MCTQADCVCERGLRMRKMPPFIHQLLLLPDVCHTAAAAGQQIRQGQKQAHMSVKLQIYFICIIQDTIRTRYCSFMYPIHDRDNTKTREKTHIYIKIRTESQKHHKSLKMFPERDLK